MRQGSPIVGVVVVVCVYLGIALVLAACLQ